MNIIEKNKIIAKFMGYYYKPFDFKLKKSRFNFWGWRKDKVFLPKSCTKGKIGDRNYLCRRHKDLKFHEDWNWLIDVIKHIKNNNSSKISNKLISLNIEKVWKSVVVFIENYNKAIGK